MIFKERVRYLERRRSEKLKMSETSVGRLGIILSDLQEGLMTLKSEDIKNTGISSRLQVSQSFV